MDDQPDFDRLATAFTIVSSETAKMRNIPAVDQGTTILDAIRALKTQVTQLATQTTQLQAQTTQLQTQTAQLQTQTTQLQTQTAQLQTQTTQLQTKVDKLGDDVGTVNTALRRESVFAKPFYSFALLML